VAMDGGSMEEGPKRKLLLPLGETDPNRLQDKRAKIDIDEVALGKVFKKILGSAEVATQPAGDNEYYELELSRVWEPLGQFRPLRGQ